MYFEMFDLFLLTLICSIIYYWMSAQKLRELALKAARSECKRLDLQLLDGSVSLNKLRLRRTQTGSLGLIRSFRFEFSATGDERYQGSIIMFGLKVESIDLPPHRIL